jgi:hypothetical protein
MLAKNLISVNRVKIERLERELISKKTLKNPDIEEMLSKA